MATNKPGEIYFENNKAKYMVVSPNENVDNVMQFLENKWLNGQKPELILSIIGGAKRFNLSDTDKESFKNSLNRLVDQTNCWVVTGGTDYGVMQLIGEALANNINKKENFKLFGISELKFAAKEKTEQSKYKKGNLIVVDNKIGDERKNKLNPFHTHFLLVDTQIDANARNEIQFRTSFEQNLARSNNLPIIQVLVEGGIGALEEVYCSARNNVPVVSIAESGGCAYLIKKVIEEFDKYIKEKNGTLEEFSKKDNDSILVNIIIENDFRPGRTYAEKAKNLELSIEFLREILKNKAYMHVCKDIKYIVRDVLKLFNNQESINTDIEMEVEMSKNFNTSENEELKYAIKIASELRNKHSYNEQDINELNIVQHTIKSLLEKVYLNYPYMHARAKSNDLEFVNTQHDDIGTLYCITHELNNKNIQDMAEELFNVNTTYVRCYKIIIEYPDSILYEVISRATDNACNIIRNSVQDKLTLIPMQNNFLEIKQPDANVCVVDPSVNNSFDHRIIWCPYSTYLFISHEVQDQLYYKLTVFNHETFQKIDGEFKIRRRIDSKILLIKPFLNRMPKNISKPEDLDGGVIFYDTFKRPCGEILMKQFNSNYNDPAHLIEGPRENVKDMFLISLRCLLIRFNESFDIVNISDDMNHKVKSFVTQGETILDIKSSVSYEKDAFMPFQDQCNSGMIFVAYQSKIQIYKFEKLIDEDRNQINIDPAQKLEVLFDYNIDVEYGRLSFILDRYFTIEEIMARKQFNEDKVNNDQISALSFGGAYNREQRTFKINELLKISKINVLNQENSAFSLNSVSSLIIEELKQYEQQGDHFIHFYDYCNNKIIFSVNKAIHKDRHKCINIIVYDTVQAAIIRKIENEKLISTDWITVSFVNENKILFLGRCLVNIYQLDNSKLVCKNYRKFDDFNYKLIGEKLIYKEFGTCKMVGLDINNDKYDYEKTLKNAFKIGFDGKPCGFIDDTHLLIRKTNDTNDEFHLCIYNVITQEDKPSIELKYNDVIIKFNKDFVLIWTEGCDYLMVYAIKYANGYHFNQLDNIKLNVTPYSDRHVIANMVNRSVKCYPIAEKENQFLITAYSKNDNYFKAIKYEFDPINAITSVKKEYIIETKNLKLFKTEHYALAYRVTYSNNHLVYVSQIDPEKNDFEITCVNIETNQCVSKQIKLVDKKFVCIVELKNDDDIVLYQTKKKSFTYIKINENYEFIVNQIPTEDNLKRITSHGNLLCVRSEENVFIYEIKSNLINLKFSKSLAQPMTSITPNKKYLIVAEQPPEPQPKLLRVFCLDDSQEVFNFPLDFYDYGEWRYKTGYVACNEKYFLLRLANDMFVTFYIHIK